MVRELWRLWLLGSLRNTGCGAESYSYWWGDLGSSSFFFWVDSRWLSAPWIFRNPWEHLSICLWSQVFPLLFSPQWEAVFWNQRFSLRKEPNSLFTTMLRPCPNRRKASAIDIKSLVFSSESWLQFLEKWGSCNLGMAMSKLQHISIYLCYQRTFSQGSCSAW